MERSDLICNDTVKSPNLSPTSHNIEITETVITREVLANDYLDTTIAAAEITMNYTHNFAGSMDNNFDQLGDCAQSAQELVDIATEGVKEIISSYKTN